MATFQKIVLGLLLLLSLLVGQPSNAQGLKYRGVVGREYKPYSTYDYLNVCNVGDSLYELGEGGYYKHKIRTSSYGHQQILLGDLIPIEGVTIPDWNARFMISPDEKSIIVAGGSNSNGTTNFRQVLIYDIQSKKHVKVEVDSDIIGISNVVDGMFYIKSRNSISDQSRITRLTLSGIKGTTSLVYDVRPRNISYDGTNVYFVDSVYMYKFHPQTDKYTNLGRLAGGKPLVNCDGTMFVTKYNGDGTYNWCEYMNGNLIREWNGGFTSAMLIRIGNLMISGDGGIGQRWTSSTVGSFSEPSGLSGRYPYLWSDNSSLGVTFDGGEFVFINSSHDVSHWDVNASFIDSYRSYPNTVETPRRIRFPKVGNPWFLNRQGTRLFQTNPNNVASPVLPLPVGSVISDFTISGVDTVYLGIKTNGAWSLCEYSFSGSLIRSINLTYVPLKIDLEPTGEVIVGGYSQTQSELIVRYSKDLASSQIVLERSSTDLPTRYFFVSSSPSGKIYVTRTGWDRSSNTISVYSRDGVLLDEIPDVQPVLLDGNVPAGDHIVAAGDIVFVSTYVDYLVKIYFADPIPPKTSASITSGWYRSNQTVQLSSVDPRPSSGFKALHSVLDTDAEVLDANPNRTINISGDGQHKLIYWAEDLDGNIETKNELSIGIDSVPPVVDSVVEGNKFILLANDDRSGIASVRYSVDGALDLEYSGELSLPYGSFEVTYWATDKAGNKSSVGKILVGSTFRWKSVYSSPIYAGKTLKATLELSAPAGSSGVTLDISSSDLSLGSLKTVTILPGKTATTIEIPVLGVESDRLVDLSASLGGKTARTSVMVLVPYPSFLSINPRDVMGGNNFTITIKLPSIAPVGGQKITLSSSDLRVVVPESVTVASGQTTITFPITTQVSSTPFSATLNARAGGKGSDAVVNVLSLPLSTFTISPAILNPGQKAVGAISLSAPAPASGVVFKLSSSSQDITVPSTVTILPGNVRVLFDITAKSPTTPVTATVTATVDKTKLTSKVSIKPSVFKAVKLSSSSFSGEGSIVGTVELTGVAPSSGSLISLASNNANVSLPATVFVPAGSLIANFTLDVKEVKTPGIATITARSGVVVKFASLTLAPITVKTLEAVPSAVTGGSASVLRIELSGKPGPGGITIMLSSSKPSVASVPASVTVAQGTTIVDVPIATSTVQTATEVVLSARVGTITKQATITVNP